MNARLRSLCYPRAGGLYGAPMGRDHSPPGWCSPRSLRVHRMPIDSGGYDPGGAYWGGPSRVAGVSIWRGWRPVRHHLLPRAI